MPVTFVELIKHISMKKIVLFMALASILCSSCYNRKHGRTGWSKENIKTVEKVRPS
jgi:hypothetical protein